MYYANKILKILSLGINYDNVVKIDGLNEEDNYIMKV